MSVIAKYKFNNTLADLLPEFNSEFTSDLYTVTDEVDGEVTTRTIESDVLPTLMRFGRAYVEGETATDNRTDSLLEILGMNTSGLTSCNTMFRYNRNLTSITCEWDTSNVIFMQYMFDSCNNLTTLDVSNFDTSNATSMTGMFNGCTSLTSLDVSNWDTGNTTNMYAMFYNCHKLTSLDVSNFDTSNVTNMGYMFNGCRLLTLLDVSNFNTSNVIGMQSMFNHCNNLTSLDVSNFNTSNVTDMSYMFCSCSNLTQLDVSNWNTSKVTNINSVFLGCSKLTHLDLSKWTFDSDEVYAQSTLHSCYALTTLDIGNWGSKFRPVYFLYSCGSLQYIRCDSSTLINLINSPYGTGEVAGYNTGLPNRTSETAGKIITTSTSGIDTSVLSAKNWSLDTSSGTKIAEYVFDKSIYNSLIPVFNDGFSGYFCNDTVNENLVTRELVGYGGLPTLMRFSTCTPTGVRGDRRELALCEVKYLDDTDLTSVALMFRGCDYLTRVTGFKTGKLRLPIQDSGSPNHMFCGCNRLTYLDTSNWDVSGILSFSYMFHGCQALPGLDVSNWDTSNTINMEYMFTDCNALSRLDVREWDTSNVSHMRGTFRSCSSLTQLDVSNWDTSKVTSMDSMFYDCNNLIELVGTNNWDTSKVINMQYMFYKCHNLKSLDLNNWDVSNVKYMFGLFYVCSKLSSLDLSNWNTSSANNMNSMFVHCDSMTFLDISNWDTTYASVTNLLTNSLTDIGMLYCSQDTVNKVITSIDNGNKTIWVKDTKASDYTDLPSNVTVKDYTGDNRELYLTSPLLEGDKIVEKDGKMYHYHKMGKVVLDGSENWRKYGDSAVNTTRFFIQYPSMISEPYRGMTNFVSSTLPRLDAISFDLEGINIYTGDDPSVGNIRFRLSNQKLSTQDAEGFKQWLQANPTTIVYELAEPYYEEIGVRRRLVLDGSTDEDWCITNSNPSSSCRVFVRWNTPNMVTFEFNDEASLVESAQFPPTTVDLKPGADNIVNSEAIYGAYDGNLCISILKSRLPEESVAGFRQWLSENPVECFYDVGVPGSSDASVLNAHANSDFSLSSDVPAKMISSKPFTMDAMYLYPSTTYTVQFVSTNATTADVYVGGATTFGQSIKPGVNHVQVTTPSTLIDNEVRISATNTEIYQIVVTDVLGNVDYFHGMKSSFEDAYIPVSLLNTEALWLNDNKPFNYTYDVLGDGLNGKTFTVINENDFEVLLYTNADGILGPTGTQQASIAIHPNSIQKFTFSNNQELRFLVTFNLDCAGQLTNVLILEGDYTNQPLPSVEDVKEYGGTYTMDITVCTSPYNFGKKGRI